MILNDSLFYEDEHFIVIHDDNDNLLYFFDYDQRSASVNMEFQHYHQFYEIMISLSSAAEHLFDGDAYHMEYGDIALIPPKLLHKSIYRKGNPSKRIIINFSYPEHLLSNNLGYSQLLSMFYMEPHIFRFKTEHKLIIWEKLNQIAYFSKGPEFCNNPLNSLMIHTLFTEFLHSLYSIKEHSCYENDANPSHITQKIYTIASYIHNNYQSPINAQLLSEKFFISPCYLSHCFKDVMQFTVTEYLHIIRVKHAQQKLKTTNDKIADIALHCGFNSFSQFNRIFNKYTGTSPSEYRKMLNTPDMF